MAMAIPGDPAGDPPVVVRLGGLPLNTVDFRGVLQPLVTEIDALLSRLDALRAELVARLFAAVPRASAELRPFLLSVKRDCHNGRPIRGRARDPRWRALCDLAGPVAERLIDTEAELGDKEERFAAAYTSELRRQRGLLWRTLDDPSFARGLALASPDLFRSLRGCGASNAAPGRKTQKIELSLLRYVTRAATKLSPFSTLTPVTLGSLRGDPTIPGLRLICERRQGRSLVRARPVFLHRIGALLRRFRPLRNALRVELNDSLVETAPGRFRYLRPQYWEVDESGVLRQQPDALVSVSPRGTLIHRVIALLSDAAPRYCELITMLARELPDLGRDRLEAEIDRLAHLGVVHLVLPWPAHDVHLEKRMLEHLRNVPRSLGLEDLVDRLDRLVALEEDYASTDDPAASIQAMNRLVDDITVSAAVLAGLDPEVIEPASRTRQSINEDVYLRPATNSPRAARMGIVELSRSSAEEAVRNADLLAQISALFDDRHEFRLLLSALARDIWADRQDVGFLESLQQTRAFWQDYMTFHFEQRRTGSTEVRTWNPLGLPQVEALHRWRVHAKELLDGCAREVGDEWHVAPDRLQELLDEAPDGLIDPCPWGVMLMMQPASADGSRWVLNQFKEGTGRYSSRYTPVMDGAAREEYLSFLRARSVIELDGEPVHLLDVLCLPDSNVNVHCPQTVSVLTAPGVDANLSGHRRLRLRDLRLTFDGPSGCPRLRGPDGQRYLPVHLGFAYEAHLPTLLRYLCVFGPSELKGLRPRGGSRQQGEVITAGRVVLGNLVLQRRRWQVPTRRLKEALACGDDAKAFVAINRLRQGWGVPERVFYNDRLPHPIFTHRDKPQYLDFTSPLFLPLLRRALDDRTSISFTEMLPTPEMCPTDALGLRWVAEVVLDSIVLRRPHADTQGRRACVRWAEPPTPAAGALAAIEP